MFQFNRTAIAKQTKVERLITNPTQLSDSEWRALVGPLKPGEERRCLHCEAKVVTTRCIRCLTQGRNGETRPVTKRPKVEECYCPRVVRRPERYRKECSI